MDEVGPVFAGVLQSDASLTAGSLSGAANLDGKVNKTEAVLIYSFRPFAFYKHRKLCSDVLVH